MSGPLTSYGPPPTAAAGGSGLEPPPALVRRLTHLVEAHAPASRTALFLGSLLHSLLLPLSPGTALPPGSSSMGGLYQHQHQQTQTSPPVERQNHTGRLLYARALLAAGAPASALHLVQGAVVATGEPALVELAQQACTQMGRWREGAWLGDIGRKTLAARTADHAGSTLPSLVHLSEATPSHTERQAAAYMLQGTLHHKGNELDKAADQYVRALAADPLCWDAFEGLCELGHPMDLADLFPPLLPPLQSHTSLSFANLSLAHPSATGSEGVGLPPASKRPRGISGAGPAGSEGSNGRKGKPRLGGVKRRALSPPSSAASDASFQDQALSPPSTSGRFSRTGTPVPSAHPTAGAADGPASAESLEIDNWVIGVMRVWGRATFLLSRYRCREAVAELDLLPKEVIRGNVDACLLVGKCWFEMVDYTKAKRAFAQARALDPYRLKSMDIYSTLLWHLHDDVLLSSLSQDLLAISRTAPESWVALGNCFSLQKEHDEAMRCFRRASQLDGAYAYAHTLSGHEAVSMEEYDRALAFFQTAVRIDKRHFNAWYGLGTAYLRKNKFRQAEHSFRRAVEINPENAVLICCVGQVLERRGLKDEALKVYEQAFVVNPDSPMVGFRRAKALASIGRIDIALPALQQLALTAPNEFNVHFLLGKIYTLLADPANAMRSFAYALDIDPKMSAAIKAAQTPRDAGDGEDGGGEADDSQMTEGA